MRDDAAGFCIAAFTAFSELIFKRRADPGGIGDHIMSFCYAVFQDRIALAAIPALKQYNSMYMMPVCINTVTVGVFFCISIVMAAICRIMRNAVILFFIR